MHFRPIVIEWFDDSAGPFVQSGQWHHVAFVLDREHRSVRIYLDGARISEQPLWSDEPLPANWGGAARVGADYFGEDLTPIAPFSGLMDEFVVYSYALSDGEILELMNLGPDAP